MKTEKTVLNMKIYRLCMICRIEQMQDSKTVFSTQRLYEWMERKKRKENFSKFSNSTNNEQFRDESAQVEMK